MTEAAPPPSPPRGEPPQAPPAQPPPPAAAPQTAGLAIGSLILGILSFLCFGIFAAIPAVICGHMGLGKIKQSSGALGGRGLAIAGLVLGYLAIVGTIIFLLLGGLALIFGQWRAETSMY